MNSIGIIGGAGPIAGAHLFKKIIHTFQREYACFRDADFPKITLLSYPFDEMLDARPDADKISLQIKSAIENLLCIGTKYITVACNTLHNFLPDTLPSHFVNMAKETLKKTKTYTRVLVLCTKTTKKYNLYKGAHFVYPDDADQNRLDHLILQTLKNETTPSLKQELLSIIERQQDRADVILLGCTELSLFEPKSHLIPIIDPIEIVASKLCHLSFQNP